MVIPKPLLHPVIATKPKRLFPRKYMTVTVGFLCTDGIVLGADSQESYEGSALKRSVPKLIALPPIDEDIRADRRAIFTGSGDGALIDKLIDEMWAEIGSAQASLDAIAAAIERKINDLYAKYRELYHPGYMPTADITYGIWCAGQSSLFHAHGPIVNKIGRESYSLPLFRSHVLGYKAGGVGADITDYIRERMRARPRSVDDAVILATYMLEQAVAHGEGCGGEIRIAYIRNDGTAENVIPDPYGGLILQELDLQISKLVLQAANPKNSDKRMEGLWTLAKKRIQTFRDKQKEIIEQNKEYQEEFDQAMREAEAEEQRQKDKLE
jgi:hypothetical protein